MIRSVIDYFVDHWTAIEAGSHRDGLLESSRAAVLLETLKNFAAVNAYQHRTVLEVELRGRSAIMDLMDWFWIGISDRDNFENIQSPRKSAFSTYMYGEISDNYRRIFENEEPNGFDGKPLSIRYRELRLLTDMISGMTDTFAIETQSRLKQNYDDYLRQK